VGFEALGVGKWVTTGRIWAVIYDQFKRCGIRGFAYLALTCTVLVPCGGSKRTPPRPQLATRLDAEGTFYCQPPDGEALSMILCCPSPDAIARRVRYGATDR
jgi:hypothetical protein